MMTARHGYLVRGSQPIEREKKFFKAGYTLGSENIHVPFEDPDKYPG